MLPLLLRIHDLAGQLSGEGIAVFADYKVVCMCVVESELICLPGGQRCEPSTENGSLVSKSLEGANKVGGTIGKANDCSKFFKDCRWYSFE